MATKSEKVIEEAKEQLMNILNGENVLEYSKKWVDSAPKNPFTGTVYGGVNGVVLNAIMISREIEQGLFGTYNNIKSAGGKAPAGRGIPVYAPRGFFKNKKDENGKDIIGKDGKVEKYWVKTNGPPRVFTVFPLEECELPNMDKFVNVTNKNVFSKEDVEEFLSVIGIELKIGGNQACFIPDLMEIHIPSKENYLSTEKFYSSVMHEVTHFFGLEFGRNMSGTKGSAEYAKEELVAEISAMYLCQYFDIQYENQDQNVAAYVSGWMSRISPKERAEALEDAFTEAHKSFKILTTRYETFLKENKEVAA